MQVLGVEFRTLGDKTHHAPVGPVGRGGVARCGVMRQLAAIVLLAIVGVSSAHLGAQT